MVNLESARRKPITVQSRERSGKYTLAFDLVTRRNGHAQPNLAFNLVSQVINNARGLSSSSNSNNNNSNNTNNIKQTQMGPFSVLFVGLPSRKKDVPNHELP